MTVKLPIKPRAKKSDNLKSNLLENIPGIIYGPKQEPILIEVSRKDFEKTFKSAGESTVLTLEGLKSPVDVLVKEVTFSPIKGGIRHVDFYALEKGKEVVTHVPLNFIGEAPTVKLGAVVNKVLHEVNVSCLAADLPAHIDVDLGQLDTLEAKILVSDLICPKGVKIAEALEATVATIEEVVETVEEVSIPVLEVDASVTVADKAETA